VVEHVDGGRHPRTHPLARVLPALANRPHAADTPQHGTPRLTRSGYGPALCRRSRERGRRASTPNSTHRRCSGRRRSAPRKQRHTAQRVFERVREELPQQPVSARSVRRAVQEWKQQRQQARAETYISQEYEPGREAQVDWYEAYAEIGGERRKLQVLCVRSMYSGAAYHRAYERATQLAFLDAQARAFEMFGGVFETLRYDNLKSAVKQILRGKRREEATRFVAFRSRYLFEAAFCTPAKGNEKGGVEQENGRFRRRWWTPVPQFASLDDLNRYLLESCIRDRERRIEGRVETVDEAFAREQSRLRRRPDEEFDLSECLKCKVDDHACVRVKHNRYSTPLPLGTEAEVRVDASDVEVRWEGELVARHARCYQVQQEILVLEHYLGVLERKPGALPHSKALAQYRQAGLWPDSFDRLWLTRSTSSRRRLISRPIFRR